MRKTASKTADTCRFFGRREGHGSGRIEERGGAEEEEAEAEEGFREFDCSGVRRSTGVGGRKSERCRNMVLMIEVTFHGRDRLKGKR